MLVPFLFAIFIAQKYKNKWFIPNSVPLPQRRQSQGNLKKFDKRRRTWSERTTNKPAQAQVLGIQLQSEVTTCTKQNQTHHDTT